MRKGYESYIDIWSSGLPWACLIEGVYFTTEANIQKNLNQSNMNSISYWIFFSNIFCFKSQINIFFLYSTAEFLDWFPESWFMTPVYLRCRSVFSGLPSFFSDSDDDKSESAKKTKMDCSYEKIYKHLLSSVLQNCQTAKSKMLLEVNA